MRRHGVATDAGRRMQVVVKKQSQGLGQSDQHTVDATSASRVTGARVTAGTVTATEARAAGVQGPLSTVGRVVSGRVGVHRR